MAEFQCIRCDEQFNGLIDCPSCGYDCAIKPGTPAETAEALLVLLDLETVKGGLPYDEMIS